MNKVQMEELFHAAASNPTIAEDLGGPEQIPRGLIMDAPQPCEFAGEGKVVRDNDAFFLPNNAEMAELTPIIQSAAIRANP